MGGRSGQGTGRGGGGTGIDSILSYTPSDADVPHDSLSAIRSDYEFFLPNKGTLENYEKFINSYTRSGYAVNKDIVDNTLSAIDIKYIKGLNASLDKIPSTKGIFERGMKLKEGSRTEKLVKLMLNNVGKTAIIDTFLSTTTNKTTAKSFGTGGNSTPVIFTVKGKNAKSVESLSSYSTEKEYMFKAGTKYKINSAVKEYDSRFNKEIYKISITEK
jgi:hypothetical protein